MERTSLLTAVVLSLAVAAAAQPPPPELTAPVNDFAGVIDAGSSQALDRLIRALRHASGDTVIVATVKTFQPWGDVRSYATKMFENGGRGIGERGKDNGLLVLLAVDDRQVWVEVGYDLEGIVTDGFAGETSRQVMAPYFRQGQYGQGLLAGTSRLIERIAAARNVTVTGVRVPAPEPARDPVSIDWIVLLFVVLFVILPLLNRRSGRRRRGWRGGVGPWGGGYYGGTWGGGSSWGGSSGGFGGFGGGRSGGGGGGASW
jgi:uncharacterized protein